MVAFSIYWKSRTALLAYDIPASHLYAGQHSALLVLDVEGDSVPIDSVDGYSKHRLGIDK